MAAFPRLLVLEGVGGGLPALVVLVVFLCDGIARKVRLELAFFLQKREERGQADVLEALSCWGSENEVEDDLLLEVLLGYLKSLLYESFELLECLELDLLIVL